MTFDELFTPPLRKWGFRGDPRLWDAMRDELSGKPVPDHFYAQIPVLKAAYATIVGVGLTGDEGPQDAVRVERLAVGHGMSDGMVSPHFWEHTAIPILVDRATRRTSSHD